MRASGSAGAQLEKTGWPTIIASSIIIVAAMVLAAFGELPMMARAENQWSPLVFALVGVVLYVMSSAKTRRNRFELRYLPDYFYRAAQAVVYLYIIMSIIAQTANGQDTSDFREWPPNLIGLFVGLFILHVEKAIEGLGQRFEEALAAILPRSLASKTSREKQLDRLRAEERFKEIKQQIEGMASQVRDPAASEALRARLTAVGETIQSGDEQGIQKDVSGLAWEFEEFKRALREEELTVADILRAGKEQARRTEQNDRVPDGPTSQRPI